MTRLCDIRNQRAFQFLLIILLGGLVYANTLHSPFLLDDTRAIVENPILDNLTRFFGADAWNSPSFRGRSVALFTFALNRQLGGLSLTGFHLVNIAIHLTCGLLIHQLTEVTISLFGDTARQRYCFAPLLAALLFVLHPIETQAVTYIVQRMASLATMLYLGSLLLYARSCLTPQTATIRRVGLHGTALAACILAMGTKEISYTLPVTLILFDLLFLGGAHRQRFMRLAPFALCLLIAPLNMYTGGKLAGAAATASSGAVVAPLPHWTYICTELRVILTYLRLLLLPVGQNFDYDYPVYRSLLEPAVYLSALALATLMAAALTMIARSFRPTSGMPLVQRICGYGILWFFITIAIESGVVPLFDVIFEHRLYLPSTWLAMAVAVGFSELYHRLGNAKSIGAIVMALLLITLAVATFRRNRVWESEGALWGDVTHKAPNQERGWASLGDYYVRRMQPQTAIPFLDRALGINPTAYPVLYNRGVAALQTGDFGHATGFFAAAVRSAPRFAQAWQTGGEAYLMAGNPVEAIRFFRQALALDPTNPVVRRSLETAMTGQQVRHQ